jgi:hypothetical protein
MTITKYEDEGYKGVDKSLDISLFEYGMIWKELENDEFRFIYRINDKLFDYGFFSEKEYKSLLEDSWFKLVDVLNCAGLSVEEFNSLSLPQRVFDIVNYYGYENIFGSCYDGFEIKDLEYAE